MFKKTAIDLGVDGTFYSPQEKLKGGIEIKEHKGLLPYNYSFHSNGIPLTGPAQ